MISPLHINTRRGFVAVLLQEECNRRFQIKVFIHLFCLFIKVIYFYTSDISDFPNQL